MLSNNLLCILRTTRPSGGVAILWNKSLSFCVKRIKPLPYHRRLCAVKLTINDADILICNAYMPNDNYSSNNVSNEFSIICDQIEMLLNNANAKFVIIGGDLNVDFRRNNAHSKWIHDMISRHGLFDTWTLPDVESGDTYVAHHNNAKSRIDYFICSTNLMSDIQMLDILKLSNNLSNHRPIKLVLDLDYLEHTDTRLAVQLDTYNKPRISWHRTKAHHIEQYKRRLDDMLRNIKLPHAVYCQDIKCNNLEHKRDIDQWCNELTNICVSAGDMCLPKCSTRQHVRPGWSDQVKSYKTESMRWHRIWVECGEPASGAIFELMRGAKRQYAYAARKVIRREKHLKFEKMAEKAASNHARNFWDEIKKMKNNTQCTPHINGLTSDEDIAELFKQKYQDLYTSVPSSDDEMNKINGYIDDTIQMTQLCDHIIFESDVTKAINHLKDGKSDGDKGLISNHVKYAPKRLHAIIAILLNTSTKHGHLPCELLVSTLTSIPKNIRHNVCDIENYRGIALSSCVSKIHDIIILNRYSQHFSTSHMQYAFKDKHGTTMCTLMLKEIASYYKRNKSETFIAMVDASKAFDRIRHDKLFAILIKRKLPAVIIRILLDAYKRQQMRVKWNKSISQTFSTLNGIKQGSISSPILFTVYIDVLLEHLEQSGFGCRIGGHYFGALSYADDLTLICPSPSGLQKMLKICETFGNDFDVKYNPSKSVLMCIGKTQELPHIYLAGHRLHWVQVVKHLGNYVRSDLKETCEISHKRGDMIGRVNSLCATFCYANDRVKQEIFNSQCCHFYGSEAWNMSVPEFDSFCKTWNQGVRKTFNLPYQTHTRFLKHFVKRPHVSDQLYRRFYKLLITMLQSTNPRVSYLAKMCKHDSRSIIGKNLQCIAKRYDFNYYERLQKPFNVNCFYVSSSQEEKRTVAQIFELRHFKCDSFLDSDEINTIIIYLCCS